MTKEKARANGAGLSCCLAGLALAADSSSRGHAGAVSYRACAGSGTRSTLVSVAEECGDANVVWDPAMSLARCLLTLALIAAPLGTGAARALSAQTGTVSTLVAGVADAESGEALEGAEVILPRLYRIGRTNSMGETAIVSVPHGVQRVRVRRLGYAPAEIDLAFSGDTTGAVFRLERTVTQLGAVNVEAEWMPPRIRDVEMRRRQGVGRFLTEVELEPDKDRDFAVAMTTRFPGLTTVGDAQGHRYLATTTGSSTLTGVAACYVTIYLDDIEVPREETHMIRTWDLAVVEYYTPAQVPARYRTKSYKCGVMLLWSKWQ